MILIFSYGDDPSTEKVIRWIRHLSTIEVVRLNESDLHPRRMHVEATLDGFCLHINEKEIYSSKVTSVWYRKGSFWFNEMEPQGALGEGPLGARLGDSAFTEMRKLREYFHHVLSQRSRTLGHADMGRLNKLIVLDHARRSGLSIPEFLASNRAESIRQRAERGTRVITKAMGNGLYLWDYDNTETAYFSYTERVNPKDVRSLADGNAVHFVQDEVEKVYEVRTFYLDGQMWSCAILSQGDEQTQVDYRKYNDNRPTRNLPYDLPAPLQDALRRLFEAVDLNTGSVDFMVDKNGTYHFLEINPSGQYDAISANCNFHLDRHVAEWLIGCDA